MAVAEGRVSATLGVLLRLREQLEFVQKGKDILEMKRNHLATRVNELLRELSGIRKEAEELLAEAYDSLKIAYSKLGYSGVSSAASVVERVEVKTWSERVMGVEVPKVVIEQGAPDLGPPFENVAKPTAHQAAEKLFHSLEKWLKLDEVEANLERIAMELMTTNRKVNALEYVVIPNFTKLIARIEDQMEEESLEEFAKAKKVRWSIWRRRR